MIVSTGLQPLIPIERELQERLAWFIRLRWLAGVGIILATWISVGIAGFLLPLWPLTLIGFSIVIYNLCFSLYRSRAEVSLSRLKRFIFVQIGMDWLALIILVHFSGGIRGPVALAFSFHLIIGAILLSRRSCYILAAFAGLMLGALTALEEANLILSYTGLNLIPSDGVGPVSSFYLWLLFSGFFLVTTYLATSITARLREKEEALYDSEHALGQAYSEMEALYQLGQLVNSTLDLGEVLQIIAENVAKLLNKKACFIRLFDASGKKLYMGGAYGLSQEYLDKGPVEVSKSAIDSETLAGNSVQVIEVADDPRFQYRAEARREGLRSVLCVPVSAKTRVLGVIRVYSEVPHVFTKREENLLKNMANLGAVAIENAHSYAELENLSEQRIWYARMTHHQLRSPLSAIQTTLDALPYAGKLSDKQHELIGRARKRVGDAFDTIRDLLDLAAAQRPVYERLEEPVLLSVALERTLETVRERSRSKGIRLDVRLPQVDPQVEMLPADIDRVFSNLLENAVKYTPQQGEITFTVTTSGINLRAEIQDSGIGIEDNLRDRIFEGFFRAPEAKATGEIGTGLGLSIVKQLVERWGGQIIVESTVGQGSTFRVDLPVLKSETKSKLKG